MSRAGSNMREIMLLMKKTNIIDVDSKEVDIIEYFPISEEDQWNIEPILMLLEEQEICGGLEDEPSECWNYFVICELFIFTSQPMSILLSLSIVCV